MPGAKKREVLRYAQDDTRKSTHVFAVKQSTGEDARAYTGKGKCGSINSLAAASSFGMTSVRVTRVSETRHAASLRARSLGAII